ncbi:MAG: LamG-like jellyroll fold domain-containing protein [Bacteroidales bacterium]
MKNYIICTILVMLLIPSLKAQVNLQYGMVGYYPFNRNANDWSGNGNHGTIHGAMPTSDRFGNPYSCYTYDGDDYIEISSSPTLNPVDQLTIAIWVKVGNLTNRYTPILHKGGEYQSGFGNREYIMYIESTGPMYTEATGITGQTFTGAVVPLNETWFFYVAVIDRLNHNFIIYLDGIKITEFQDNNNSFMNNNEPIKLASWDEINPQYAPFFIGCIDDLRLYNRPLNIDEIQALYNEGTTDIAVNECSKISLAPNPTSDRIYISGLKENVKLSVFNLYGKMVLNKQTFDNQLKVGSLQAGIYFLKIEMASGILVKRFIKIE